VAAGSNPAVPTLRTALRDALPALLVAATVGQLARHFGGWYPSTWGWASVGLLFVAACALILRQDIRLGRLEIALVAALVALTAWTGLSWLWSNSPPRSMLELERTSMYLAGTLAFLVVARRRSFVAILASLLVVDVAICVHALATRLFPDHFVVPSVLGARLGGVLTYANALGIVAVIGLLLALAFAVDGERAWARSLAAAATVPLVLTLFFTFSRGSWLALGVGLAAGVALDPARRRLVATIAPLSAVSALVVWLAWRSAPLTSFGDPAAAAPDGHRLAVATVLLSLAAATAVQLRPRWRALGAVAVVAVAFVPSSSAPASPAAPSASTPVQAGAPAPTGAPKPTPAAPGPDQTARLFAATSSYRSDYWRVAARDFADHPVAGSGAGTYALAWIAHRPNPTIAQDAHNLYLETLAELGVIGLSLLLVALAIPFVAASRVRRLPLVWGAFAAYAAFVAHAGVDWDWELPAVTFAGLFCGLALVVAAREQDRELSLSAVQRGVALAAVLLLTAFGFVALVGNRAEARSLHAAWRGDWKTTGTEARRARTWAPWSTQALVLAADADAYQGDYGTAVELIRQAVRKDPGDWDLWDRLATVTQGAEHERALARVSRLNPLSGRTTAP
jgi:hypothetical protein